MYRGKEKEILSAEQKDFLKKKEIATYQDVYDLFTLFSENVNELGIKLEKIFPERKNVKSDKDFLNKISSDAALGNTEIKDVNQSKFLKVALDTLKKDLEKKGYKIDSSADSSERSSPSPILGDFRLSSRLSPDNLQQQRPASV